MVKCFQKSILFLLVVFVSGKVFAQGTVHDTPAADSPPQDIEIYVEGKRYSSFEEYRLKKFQGSLADVVNSVQELEVKDQGPVSSQPRVIEEGEKALGPTEKVIVIERRSGSEPEDQNGQEEKMLNEYYLKHKNEEPLEIDAGKMKVIEIKPQENTLTDETPENH